MRSERSEFTANVALSQAPRIGYDMCIGLHFAAASKHKHNARKVRKAGWVQTFRNMFKTGAVK